jgi:SAM-dependent methyltransferase
MNIPIKGRTRACYLFLNNENLRSKTLLDIGCSNGWLLSLLKGRGLKKAIGVDPNIRELQTARKNVPWAQFFISTSEKLPIENESIDIVTFFDVLEHLPKSQERSGLTEIKRVLKKNGVLLLSTPNNNFVTNSLDPVWYFGHRHYDLKKLGQMVEMAGFKIILEQIRGGFWSALYILWFYVMKWVFGEKYPRNKWLEKRDDQEFQKQGIHTIYVRAVRTG